ncbi:MAG: DUF423 domain-containing protein [Gammaproteobacteria bacterium]|nr:DUF423 domain-containing protein [Gammaproteobacteria bacterium]
MFFSSSKIFAVSGALLCLFAVLLGAFGAHALKDLLEQNARLDTFELANRYQFFHGLALLIISGRYDFVATFEKLIGFCILVGVIVFSGSLYVLSISNFTWLGAVTPIGGLLLILGWGTLAVKEWR